MLKDTNNKYIKVVTAPLSTDVLGKGKSGCLIDFGNHIISQEMSARPPATR